MAISWLPLGLLCGRTTAGCITALFISLHRLCAFSFMSKNSPRPMTALCPCTGPEAQGSLTSGPSFAVCLSFGLVSSPKGRPKAQCRPCLLCVRQHVLVCYNKLAGLAGLSSPNCLSNSLQCRKGPLLRTVRRLRAVGLFAGSATLARECLCAPSSPRIKQAHSQALGRLTPNMLGQGCWSGRTGRQGPHHRFATACLKTLLHL